MSWATGKGPAGSREELHSYRSRKKSGCGHPGGSPFDVRPVGGARSRVTPPSFADFENRYRQGVRSA